MANRWRVLRRPLGRRVRIRESSTCHFEKRGRWLGRVPRNPLRDVGQWPTLERCPTTGQSRVDGVHQRERSSHLDECRCLTILFNESTSNCRALHLLKFWANLDVALNQVARERRLLAVCRVSDELNDQDWDGVAWARRRRLDAPCSPSSTRGSIKWSTEIVNDRFGSAARNARNDRRKPNDGNSHE